MRYNGQKLKLDKLRLERRLTTFKGSSNCCNRLPKDKVDSPSFSVFQSRLALSLKRYMITQPEVMGFTQKLVDKGLCPALYRRSDQLIMLTLKSLDSDTLTTFTLLWIQQIPTWYQFRIFEECLYVLRLLSIHKFVSYMKYWAWNTKYINGIY